MHAGLKGSWILDPKFSNIIVKYKMFKHYPVMLLEMWKAGAKVILQGHTNLLYVLACWLLIVIYQWVILESCRNSIIQMLS